MKEYDYKKMTPFKFFVLQNFPFIEEDFDAITNWQLFEKIGHEMNKVIKVVNDMGVAVEYISNYFDNLDVQEEVNKKLDEMAESGELTEIIAQYLDLQGILAYNTVSDLSNAENMANGSFAKTYGKTTYNDGEGAFYKVRTLLNTDVIDGDNLVALVNYPTLVAEKMTDAEISALNTKIGTITNLNTTNKNNLVVAINEVNTKIGTLASLNTTEKTDIVGAINEVNNNTSTAKSMARIHTLLNKKTIVMGDSLCITGRWGTYFATYSGADAEVYGNGSAGFISKGVTSPFENMNFLEMLTSILSTKTEIERNLVEYLVLGGGINDALNSYTPTAIATAVQNFITYAKANLPKAKLIIFPLHTFKWLSNTEIARYQAILDTLKFNGLMTTGDFLFWTVDDRTYDDGGHIHLTDAGYQQLAKRILSFVLGTQNADIENIEFTLAEDFTNINFAAIKIGNIVYLHGQIQYTGGTLPNNAATPILTFDKGALLTGSSNWNFYIPCIMYGSGTDANTTVSLTNGEMKTGRPRNFSSLSNPYFYINGSFPVGLNGPTG